MVLEIALFSPVLRYVKSKAVIGVVASLAIAMAGSTPVAASSKDYGSRDRSEKRQALTKGDVAEGRKVFAARCSVCHGADAIGGAMAPNLTKAFGSKAAAATFARYSAALKASGLIWTPSNLDSFLAAPGKVVVGTLMMTAVASPTDRTDLIAYLASIDADGGSKDRH